jgi:hypothetical protein
MSELLQVATLIATAMAVAENAPTATSTCPVTLAASHRFAEPSPSSASRFWYGDERLAVLLKAGGRWRGMGSSASYRDKLFWWRQGYDGAAEPTPKLVVTGRRLDGDASTLATPRATNARHADFGGWAMLVALEFPVGGCWQVTGEYQGQKLSFVVDVRE